MKLVSDVDVPLVLVSFTRPRDTIRARNKVKSVASDERNNWSRAFHLQVTQKEDVDHVANGGARLPR